ncbi:MAG: amidohydrolase family protein [Acidimicrobiales bacterium]
MSARRGLSVEPLPPRAHLRAHVLPDGGVRDVYVVEGRITFEPVGDATTILDGGWLLPGLVDGHAHLSLASPAGPAAPAEERVAASAAAQLAAGVLVVREPGSPDHSSRLIGPERGLPRTLSAGQFLAPPDGYFTGLARELPPADLDAAVAEEAAARSGWVKLVGDFPDAAGRLTRNWEATTLAAAAAAAHAASARITIHAVLPETISDAIDAGFDAIEHGTGMPTDLVPVLAERGIIWVPTLLISDGVRQWARQTMAPSESTRVDGWLTSLPKTVAAAARAGVSLLAGTDAGMVPHGMISAELQLLVAAGVPQDQAVAAASWTARHCLGLPGIEEGAPADLLAVADDPRLNPDTLACHTLTVLDGRRIVPEPIASSNTAEPRSST